MKTNLREKEFNLQEQSYDIDKELKAIKILNDKTPSGIFFEKNDNDYGVDVLVYYITRDNFKRHLFNIELEFYTGKWGKKDKPFWHEISLLMRKLYEWDNANILFTKEPKKGYKKTFYMKFNKNLTNCFLVRNLHVIKNGYESRRSNRKRFNDGLMALKIDDPKVIWGLEESLNKINKILKRGMEI